MSQTASVIGFGRFGAFWASLLAKHFSVLVHDADPGRCAKAREQGFQTPELATVLSADAIFYCVPIAAFESVITSHREMLASREPKVIFDCLSVKVHPKNIFTKLSLPGWEIGLLHPLFGPDSVRVHGLSGLPLAIDQYTLSDATCSSWIHFFQNLGIHVLRLSAEEHDALAANSQGLTHYIGRILGAMNITPSSIDTVGAIKLHEIKEQVCNDSDELFHNLQQYNPYTLPMRIALGAAQAKIYSKLLPNRVNNETLVIGIQGGPGSFNEEAATHYLARLDEKNFHLEYLYTSEAVLKALYEGRVDRGIFAIHNSLGGIVEESVQAMSKYTFSIIDEFSIIISHCLLMHPSRSLDTATSIMGHSQALRQCAHNLRDRFPHLQLQTGAGELADPSRIAQEICAGKISPSTAVLGSRALAAIYGLEVKAENLQDLKENHTHFLWVER